MKRLLLVLLSLFGALLLLACSGTSTIINNDSGAEEGEPIRIVATAQAATAVPSQSALATEAVVEAPTEAPTSTPAPSATPSPTPAPTPTPEPTATPVPTATPEPDMAKSELFCTVAEGLVDYPYVRGGSTPEEGFDPGGFVCYCLNQTGLSVKRRTSSGYGEVTEWQQIDSMDDLIRGDLVFFRTGDNENINCVCIYLGDGKMIYPSSSKEAVIIVSINSDYWLNAFMLGRRVF